MPLCNDLSMAITINCSVMLLWQVAKVTQISAKPFCPHQQVRPVRPSQFIFQYTITANSSLFASFFFKGVVHNFHHCQSVINQ